MIIEIRIIIFEYDSSKKIKDQSLKKETMYLVSGIYLNYCVDEINKKRLLTICENNEKKHQNELKEKYSLDNIFRIKNEDKIISNESNAEFQMIEYKKQKFYVRIFRRLLDLFKK